METEQDKENITPQEQGCGAILTAERKKQNKSIEEVSQVLNLSVTQLKTIEQDKSEGLPGSTYVRGYISAYAMLLGLDPVATLEHYQDVSWNSSASLNGLPRSNNNEFSQSNESFFSWVKWLVVVALIGLVFNFVMSGGFGELLSDTSKLEKGQVLTKVNDNELVDTSPSDVEVTEVELIESQVELPINSSEQATFSEDSSFKEKNNLALSFSDTSWIDIRDSNGKRLAYKSYANGDELVVSSDLSISVFIGNAAGVKVLYNGEDFNVGEHQEGVYAKFTIGNE